MKNSLYIFITALIVTSQVIAGEYKNTASNPEKAQSFLKLDRNQDGVISREEVNHLPWVSKIFNTLDKDGNKTLSRFEYETGINKEMEKTNY